ncbi:Gamma-glutamyltranspeptidase [compost metagenome]
MPDVISAEKGTLDAQTVTALEAMGHKVNAGESTWGNLQTVSWDKRSNVLEAGTDPRNPVGKGAVEAR